MAAQQARQMDLTKAHPDAVIAHALNLMESRLQAESDDLLEEAPEGRLLTRVHLRRERNRELVESKKRLVLKQGGSLTCEVCGFNFKAEYGERGDGFIECHHTKPLEALEPGAKTHVRDLALVCSNCHRMIHRRRPWLSINELRQQVVRTPAE